MAFIAKQRYKLDIAPRGGWVIVYASRHDDGAREIEFEITNQGRAFSIPASINVSVQGIKSNGSYFSHSCSYSGNIVTMALADDMTDIIGKAICVLKFTNSSQQKLATAKFVLNVDTDASSEGIIIDTDAEEIFNQMLNDIRAQAASISADIAELQSMVGSPLVASTVSTMTDHNKIYVYVGSESGYTNGNWYYWNGSAWTSGGVYNSVAINIDSVPTQGSSNAVSSGGVYNALDTLQVQIPQIDTTLTQAGQAADAKKTGDNISELNSDLESVFSLSKQYVDMSKSISDKRYGAINVSLYDDTGYYVIPMISLKAGTYYYKNVVANFSHYIYSGEETINTFSGSGRISGSITFESDVVIYLTSNSSYGNVMFANDVLPQSYVYGIYEKYIKEGIINVDSTLSEDGTSANSKTVGNLFGVNGVQYLNESNFVSDTRYGTTNITTVTASGYFTVQPILLKAGTYYFRNVYTDFSHVVNKSTGARTSLSSLVGAGRVSGSVTIEYDFYLYITANTDYDTLANGKVVWCNYPYHSMGNNRVYGLFGTRPDSNRYSENVRPVFTVEKDGKGDFITIKEALETAVLYPNSIVKVGQGTFDLIEEFGADYFANLGAVGNSGLQLYNDITVEFTSNTLVTCHYTGDNSNVMHYFSPFNLKKSAGYFGGFTLKNLHLECSNVRYGVHDESNAFSLPYRNKYLNCNIKVDNRNNTAFSARQCIGGGLGSASEIIIRDCVFESVVNSGTSGTGIVSYHNGGTGRSDIIIKDCYFKGSDTVKASWHGTSTKVSTMTVSGCSVGLAPYNMAEASGDTIENMELITWNNEIRSA